MVMDHSSHSLWCSSSEVFHGWFLASYGNGVKSSMIFPAKKKRKGGGDNN